MVPEWFFGRIRGVDGRKFPENLGKVGNRSEKLEKRGVKGRTRGV